jgi:hypothetical protein
MTVKELRELIKYLDDDDEILIDGFEYRYTLEFSGSVGCHTWFNLVGDET